MTDLSKEAREHVADAGKMVAATLPEREAVEQVRALIDRGGPSCASQWPEIAPHLRSLLTAYDQALSRVGVLTRERDIALELHQSALRLAGVDVTEAYEIGRGLRPSPFESGWLIEAWDSKRNEFKAEWWSLDLPDHEDGQGWTKDSLRALRFGRQQDAQAYIDDTAWTEAKPTEHGWGKPVAALQPPLEVEVKP